MLERQAVQLQKRDLLHATAGCAGFAKVLAQQLFPNGRKVSYTLDKPLVVVCGSVNPITKKQIEYTEKKHYPRISLSAQQLLTPDYWKSPVGQVEIMQYLTYMENHPLMAFETFSEGATNEMKRYSDIHGLSTQDCRFRIGESLGRLTEALWTQHQHNTFLFTGGDTLYQSMNVLGVKGIRPVAEISPGVVLSAITWNDQEMQVITKSGGFGTEQLFEEISLS